MFRRRRSADDIAPDAEDATDATDAVDLDDVDDVEEELDEADYDDESGDEFDGLDDDGPAATTGPFDVEDVDDGIDRLDLGALRVVAIEDIEIRIEVDEVSGAVQAVTMLSGESVLQVGVFAAPRTEGIWDDVRTQIAAGITSSGGTVDPTTGEFGDELRARLPGEDDKGRRVLQPVRFIGVDGPRWFIRGLLSGPAVDDEALAAPLMGAFRQIVVVRGTDPMAPHEPLPIVLPTLPGEETGEGEAVRPDLNPFRRGPEITEIR